MECHVLINRGFFISTMRLQIIRHFSTIKMADNFKKVTVGICQVTCTEDKISNFLTAKKLVEQCKIRGAEMVFLPEACDYIAGSRDKSMAMAEGLEGETLTKYKQLAKDQSVWLSLGSVHQKPQIEGSSKLKNTHVILDSLGNIRSTYSKVHLFDLDIPGKIRLCESDYTIKGENIVTPVDTPAGKVGLGICYDMRFPEMSVALRNLGAEILTFPSAFTVPTGMAHWHVLLRNRAIENQCYVIAAAQTGKHNEKRSSYGHSLVVDPWGTVIAECSEGEGICTADIDLHYLHKVRQQMPVQDHRRSDLYGHIHVDSKGIDEVPYYDFGGHQIPSTQVFYQTALSYAFVNIKPVKPGHVLVSTRRSVKRFADLMPVEVSDLFNAAKIVSTVVQKHFNGTSVTVNIQDGADAGQTVSHVHVHVLPRQPGDFKQNDDIYGELEKHDKNLETERQAGKLRTDEEMNTEAAELRPYFV